MQTKYSLAYNQELKYCTYLLGRAAKSHNFLIGLIFVVVHSISNSNLHVDLIVCTPNKVILVRARNSLPPSSAWGVLLNLKGKPGADHDQLNSEHQAIETG